MLFILQHSKSRPHHLADERHMAGQFPRKSLAGDS
jgi:hypothetical protein